MLATKRDDTSNVLNMQHIILNSKRLDYSDMPGGGRLGWLSALAMGQLTHGYDIVEFFITVKSLI